MSRAQALQMLEALKPFDHDEGRNRKISLYLLQTVKDIFHRECNEPGHITASAIVCNPSGSRVLLNKHGITGNYINFGGHADGDEDLLAVAKRELEEEAGITNIEPDGQLFDIDFHYMAPHLRKGQPVPEHVHCDFTWLFRVPDDVKFILSDESTDIRWFTLEEAMVLHAAQADKDAQMQRFYQKIAAGLR